MRQANHAEFGGPTTHSTKGDPGPGLTMVNCPMRIQCVGWRAWERAKDASHTCAPEITNVVTTVIPVGAVEDLRSFPGACNISYLPITATAVRRCWGHLPSFPWKVHEGGSWESDILSHVLFYLHAVFKALINAFTQIPQESRMWAYTVSWEEGLYRRQDEVWRAVGAHGTHSNFKIVPTGWRSSVTPEVLCDPFSFFHSLAFLNALYFISISTYR